MLYSQNFSSPSVHVIIVRNQADPRGSPTGNSQLTLDRFELDLPVTAPNTITVTQNPTTAVQTPTESASGGSDKDTSTNQVPIGGIVGGAVGGLAAIALLVILIFWLRRRRTDMR